MGLGAFSVSMFCVFRKAGGSDNIKHSGADVMFQASHNILPSSLSDTNRPLHAYSTRHSSDHTKPLYRLNLSQQSIRYAGPATWNAITNTIKGFPSITSFQCNFNKYLFNYL